MPRVSGGPVVACGGDWGGVAASLALLMLPGTTVAGQPFDGIKGAWRLTTQTRCGRVCFRGYEVTISNAHINRNSSLLLFCSSTASLQ